MSTSSGGTGNVGPSQDPTNPWDAANAQYIAAQNASVEAMSTMQTLLEEIIHRKGKDGQKISTDQAYQELVQLSSNTTDVKGTEAGIQGSTQNLGAVGTQQIAQLKGDLSTLESWFAANPQGDFTPFSSLPQNIQDTVNQFNSLFSSLRTVVNQQSALPETIIKPNTNPPESEPNPYRWMDTATCQSMTSQLDAIATSFGGKAGDLTLNTSNIANNINAWVGPAGGSAGASSLQQLSGSINEIGGGFGAITSTQSGLLQNTMAMVTMMLNTMRGTITSINSSAMAMVRGQRAAS